jgi:uncharacterized protein (DUF2126 family)/transglutaminase-like putative cysteine protease
MGTKVKVSHKTTYQYDRPVNLGPQLIRLKPAAHARTKVLSYSLQVSPKNHFINWIQDPYGNYQARILFPEKVSHFTIEVDLGADLTVFNPFDFFLDPDAQVLPVSYPSALTRDLSPYLEIGSPGPSMMEYLAGLPPKVGNTIDYLVGLNQKLSKDIHYNIRMEPNVQSSEKTLEIRSGSCRDSALLFLEILRHQGFPSRFVSGYLIQLKPDLVPISGAQGASEDFTDLHAWTEVYVPGAGWIGLDPTSGLFTGEGHIPLAASPWPSGAAPIEGSLDPCEVSFSYEMHVRRINNQPRSTNPFPEDPSAIGQSPQFDAQEGQRAGFIGEEPATSPGQKKLLDLGEVIDQRLKNTGFTLTIGGEPTFISDTDRNEPEWNGEALGPTKKGLSQQLIRRLAQRWAPGAILHSSQGKWYPGESLPRWSLSCFWRKDGQKLWKEPSLMAQEEEDYGYNHQDAKTLMDALVDQLGVNPEFVMEAFEDPIHFLTKERDLPMNVTPGDPKLANPEDRHRMIQVFQRGLDQSIGFVLPVQRGSWKSGPWPLRSGRLVLVPGDSPIGLRLPLDSLPWAKDGENVPFYESDPMGYSPAMSQAGRPGQKRSMTFAPVTPTPESPGKKTPESQQKKQKAEDSPGAPQQQTQDQPLPTAHPPLIEGESAAWVVRTALCVQAREGKLFIFMPPARTAEDWFALVEEIEATCQRTGLKVILEGYPPPYGAEHLFFQITPDPGVIEVNLPPVDNTRDLHRLLSDLWSIARQLGLSSIKYLIGGQEVGSGGGCHWVLGGPTPAESPFILRPDLLRSWIMALNRHPSLSYLFSGLFIGATSQAPRFDEANPHLLEEMELAFKEVDWAEDISPWLTDRIFRNLLVDGTGNTHRAELCIDKLYSPDRPSGRLGLVEFRSFEMAPHKDMALAQTLLLRALTLQFLETPLKAPLVKHGAALKDRWMLPYFLEEDFRLVLKELAQAGLDFPWEPFAAQLDFRFPVLGEWEYEDVQVELRQALEPWPVMGEEGSDGGTVRYVDSSVERLQLRVRGLDLGQRLLSCAGLQLPLVPLEDGSMICGVRFKAWELSSGLHPTLPATPKLVFDLYDRSQGIILGGFTYHVSHPAGRNYEEPPVNEFEAESRRQARFWAEGQTPGIESELPKLVLSPEFPHTLSIHGHRQNR